MDARSHWANVLPLRLVPEKNHPFKFCDCVLRRPIVVYIFFQIHDNIYIYFIYMIYVVFVQHISKLKTLQNHYQPKARAPVEQNDLLAQHRSWAVDQHFSDAHHIEHGCGTHSSGCQTCLWNFPVHRSKSQLTTKMISCTICHCGT